MKTSIPALSASSHALAVANPIKALIGTLFNLFSFSKARIWRVEAMPSMIGMLRYIRTVLNLESVSGLMLLREVEGVQEGP
jgi:hypothetical protein